jgi:plastocyanin
MNLKGEETMICSSNSRKRQPWITGFLALAVFLSVPSIQAQDSKSLQPGGTIKGALNTPWVKRYQAVVYVDRVKGNFPPPSKNPFISQKNLVFSPHILPILKGSTVDFTNDDSVDHNVFSPPGSATQFNLGLYGSGVKKTMTFNNLGEVPLLCNVHPEMLGYILVLQNPYYALTDKNGEYEIKNVPPGSYQLKVWDEKLQGVSKAVTVLEGKTVIVNFDKEMFKER